MRSDNLVKVTRLICVGPIVTVLLDDLFVGSALSGKILPGMAVIPLGLMLEFDRSSASPVR